MGDFVSLEGLFTIEKEDWALCIACSQSLLGKIRDNMRIRSCGPLFEQEVAITEGQGPNFVR